MNNQDPLEEGKQLYKQLLGLGVKFYQRNEIDVYAYVNDIIWDLFHKRQITDLLLQVGVDPDAFTDQSMAYFTLRTIAQLMGEELTDQIASTLPEYERPKVRRKRGNFRATYPWTYTWIRDQAKQGTLL